MVPSTTLEVLLSKVPRVTFLFSLFCLPTFSVDTKYEILIACDLIIIRILESYGYSACFVALAGFD